MPCQPQNLYFVSLIKFKWSGGLWTPPCAHGTQALFSGPAKTRFTRALGPDAPNHPLVPLIPAFYFPDRIYMVGGAMSLVWATLGPDPVFW